MTTASDGKRRTGDVARLTARLDHMREAALEQAAEAVAQTAADVAGHARRSLRRSPGGLPRLADRMEIEAEGPARRVTARHPAAVYVEYGTRHRAAHPFLQPAADAARAPFRERMMTRVRRLLRGGS